MPRGKLNTCTESTVGAKACSRYRLLSSNYRGVRYEGRSECREMSNSARHERLFKNGPPAHRTVDGACAWTLCYRSWRDEILMKAYVITTGIVFALLAMAHILRAIEEGSQLIKQPSFVLITLAAAALSLWAMSLLRRSRRP
jgi:hypothetical protein